MLFASEPLAGTLEAEDAARERRRAVAAGVGYGLFTAVLLAVIDLGDAAVRLRFGSLVELVSLPLSELSTLLVAGAVLGASGVLWAAASRSAARGLTPARRRIVEIVLTSLPLAVFGCWLAGAWFVTSWPNLGRYERIAGCFAMLAIAGTAAVVASLLATPPAETARFLTRRVVALSAAALALALLAYDRSLPTGLYPELRSLLVVHAVLAMAVAVRCAGGALGNALRRGRAPTVLAVGALVIMIALEGFEVRAATATDTLVYGGVVRLLRRVTDFDGDGSSSFFGGRDCRAFDGRFAPGKRDLPDNGLDEDCSGSDARPPRPIARSEYRVIDARGFNVVWLSIDALRADHVGSYGYGRKTTPNVDAIARDAIRFERAYAQSTATWDSVPSMLSGRYPHALSRDYAHPRAMLGRRWYSYHLGPGTPLIADLLARSGYATGGFASFRLFHWLGFDEHFAVYERTTDNRRSGVAFVTTAKEPFFHWQHLHHPHEPYVPHDGFDFGPSAIDRYDGEIALADSIVGAFVEGLKKRGVFERTILIVTADHGEALGERGAKYHGRSCYENQMRVPLIVRVPGVRPAVVKAPVELVGIVPMLHELLRLPVGSLRLDGESLLSALAAPDPRATRGAYCEYVSEDGVNLQSLINRDWKLISDYERDRIELYHLEIDPAESDDRSREEPAITERLLSELGHRHARP